MRCAIGGFAGRQKQRIAAFAHERIGAEHSAELQRVGLTEIAARHPHRHSSKKRHFVATRAALPIVDAVEAQVAHQHPVARHRVNGFMRCGIGLEPSTPSPMPGISLVGPISILPISMPYMLPWSCSSAQEGAEKPIKTAKPNTTRRMEPS